MRLQFERACPRNRQQAQKQSTEFEANSMHVECGEFGEWRDHCGRFLYRGCTTRLRFPTHPVSLWYTLELAAVSHSFRKWSTLTTIPLPHTLTRFGLDTCSGGVLDVTTYFLQIEQVSIRPTVMRLLAVTFHRGNLEPTTKTNTWCPLDRV